MAKIKKRKVRWSSTYNPEVAGYKLYWTSNGEGVDYESDSYEVGNVSEIILPDHVTSFPLISGDVELGITAVSRSGNESDMTKFTASFDFTVPDAPTDLAVEEDMYS